MQRHAPGAHIDYGVAQRSGVCTPHQDAEFRVLRPLVIVKAALSSRPWTCDGEQAREQPSSWALHDDVTKRGGGHHGRLDELRLTQRKAAAIGREQYKRAPLSE